MNNEGLDKMAAELESIQRVLLFEAAGAATQKEIETYQSGAKSLSSAIFWLNDAKAYNK